MEIILPAMFVKSSPTQYFAAALFNVQIFCIVAKSIATIHVFHIVGNTTYVSSYLDESSAAESCVKWWKKMTFIHLIDDS